MVTVTMKDIAFQPAKLTIKAGTMVLFRNDEDFTHSAVALSVKEADSGAQPGFGSPKLEKGQSWSYTFARAGAYTILCNVDLHYKSGMVMTVEVQ